MDRILVDPTQAAKERVAKIKQQQQEALPSVNRQLNEAIERWNTNSNKLFEEQEARQKEIDNPLNRMESNAWAYRADASEWDKSVQERSNEIENDANTIRKLLDEYEGYFDAEWVKNIREGLRDKSKSILAVRQIASNSKEYSQGLNDTKQMYEDLKSDDPEKVEAASKKIVDANKSEIDNLISAFNNALKDPDSVHYMYAKKDRKERGGFFEDYVATNIPAEELFSNYTVPEEMSDSAKLQVYNLIKEGNIQDAIRFVSDYRDALQKQDFTEFAKKHPIAGALGGIALNLAGGLEYVANSIDALGRTATGREDIPAVKNKFTEYASALHQGNTERVDWNVNFGDHQIDVADMLYYTLTSAAESLAMAFVPGGFALLGASAAASSYNDILDRGGTHAQAIFGGLAAGVFEGLFEKFSIGNIKALKDVSPKTIKGVFGNFLKSAGVNLTEELATEAANILYDSVVNYDISNAKKLYEEAMQRYNDEKKARNYVARELGIQIAEAAVSGALSGGLLGGGISSFKYSARKNSIKNAFSNNPQLLIKLANSIRNDADVKRLAEIASTELVDNGKVSTKTLNELYTAIESNDFTIIESAITNRLATLGESEYEEVASAITKKMQGVELSKLENKILKESKYAEQVQKELDATKENAIDWVKNIGTTVVNAGKFNTEATQNEDIKETLIDESAAKNIASDINQPMSPRDLASERTANVLDKTVGVLNNITAANPKADVIQDTIAKSSGVKRLSDNQKILRKIGQSFGAKVEFANLDYTVDGKVVSPEGQYDPNTNTITLNTNVKDYHRPVQFILKHELSHSLEKAGKAYERFMAEVELSEEFEKYAKSRYAIDERTGNAAYFKDVDEWYDYIIEEYKKANKPLGNETTDERTAAKMEAVADFVADKLFGGRDADMQKLLEAFQPETRKTFIEWVKGVFAKIKQVFKGRTELTEIENLEKQFLDVAKKVAKMNEAEAEQQKTTTYEGSGVKYSYPGEMSLTADKSLLAKAIEMEADKKDTNLILEETGWFKGGDGKWRYMISDKDMKYYPNGYLANKQARRYRELEFKYITDTENMTAAEIDELKMLSKNLVGVSKTPTTLDEFIRHDDLFAAYPQLKSITVRFENTKSSKGGHYDPVHHEIVINSNLRDNVEKAKDIFIHEIQHVIQYIEGFANGGNVELAKKMVFNRVYELVKNSDEFKSLTPNEKVDYIIDRICKELNVSNIDEAAKKAYLSIYGEIEAREVSKNRAKTLNELKKEAPFTDGILYDIKRTNKEFLDVLDEIGYTEKQIRKKFGGKTSDQSRSTQEIQGRMGSSEVGSEVSDDVRRVRDNSLSGHHRSSRKEPRDMGRGVRSAVRSAKGQDEVLKLFNSENPDIRYSLPPNATQREIADAYKQGEIDFAEYEKRINKLFDDKVQQNGAIKGGQIIAPPNKRVSVPESVSTDTKVRQHIRTILESGYATPEMEAYFKELILDGKYSYTPTSDSKNIARATKNITRQGYENAKYNWEKAIDKSGTGAEAVATGEALLRLAFEHKNVVDIVNLSAELAEFGTRTAQSLQAFSLLKKMGGLGQLVYIQRTVNRLNADLEKRFKKNPPVVKIDGKLAERLAKAKTEGEYEVIYGKIMQDIASQVPPTFLDKWHAWRYMAMLFNPTTHVRNFVGNGIFIPAVRTKDLLAAAMEKTISVDKRTKSVIIGKEYKQYAANDFENVKDILTGSGKYNPSDAVSEYRRIFKTKFLESARKFNFDLLENEDLIFLKAHYKHALASFLQARKLDVKNISESQLVQAREYAINEALKATYRDASRVANMISQLSKAHPVANVLVEGTMPFKKTPINILKRGARYSPLGLIKTATYGIYELKSGKISASQFIDGLASGFTGSIVAVIGAFLAALGVAKGSFDDEEKWFRKMNGEQEFSVEIAGKSYTIDWAAPASIPFFIGVAIAEYNADEDADILSMIYDFGMAGFNPMLQLSMLSGIEDVIASVSYAEKGRKVAALAGATIKSYFAQALPTIFGKTANLFDDTRRTSYIDKTSNVPELVQKAWDKIAQKVPFVSKTRAEYIDAWGNTKYTGNFIQRFFQQYVSPGQASTVNVTDISEEISRLHKVTGESGIYPETPEKYFKFRDIRRDLSKEEYFEYATFKGKTQAELVNEAIHSKNYASLTDEQKVTVIKNLYKYAGALAKCQLDYSYEEISAMVGENKKGEKILTKEKYDKLNDEARRLLVIEYFTESASVVKAYKSQKNGKSVVEYFIKKALTDK